MKAGRLPCFGNKKLASLDFFASSPYYPLFLQPGASIRVVVQLLHLQLNATGTGYVGIDLCADSQTSFLWGRNSADDLSGTFLPCVTLVAFVNSFKLKFL